MVAIATYGLVLINKDIGEDQNPSKIRLKIHPFFDRVLFRPIESVSKCKTFND